VNKITAYMSHHIRGPEGDKATMETIEANNKAARLMGAKIRELIPELDLYVPGDQDQVIMYLCKKGYVTTEQILEADCVIISQCKFMIVFNRYDSISGGMQTEVDHCMYNCIPFIYITDLNERELAGLRDLVKHFQEIANVTITSD